MFFLDFFRKIKFVSGAYHFFWAYFSALVLGFPSRKIKVIGVTGTKGKSTTIDLASRIFEEAGRKTASLSSIRFKIGNKEEKNTFKMTSPGRGYLQKFLKKAINAGCSHAILEITSEGILQHRQKFIDFDAAVFTNLAPEHIERHGSFNNYRAAKGKLFEQTKSIHILNLDDKNFEFYFKFEAEKKFGFKIKDWQKLKEKNLEVIKAEGFQAKEGMVNFRISGVEFILKLPGKFNIYNALAAISIARSQGISLEVCRQALKKVEGIPGRMEVVVEKPFKVIVDYAHMPDALESVFSTLLEERSQNLGSKLICIIGSQGGGRDKWKRPNMGEIAGKYCDKIIVANEDPYDEDPMQIVKEVALKIKDKAEIILDRREAIREALKSARKNDIVIITGKGCESLMCVKGGKKIAWDDREIVREELQKLNLKVQNSK